MSKLPFFLAARFFRADGENKAKASRPAVRVSTISVAVSLAVMIVTVGVVRGFQREIRATLSGFASHITLLNPLSFYNPEAAPIVIDEGVERDVRACLPPGSRFARFSTKSGILKTDDAYAAITLKGIGADYDTAFLKSRLAEGRLPAVGTERGKREILLSRLTADQLKLKRGDRIAAYFFERTVKMRRFDIVGIYDTHMPQFDRFFAVTDIAAVNTLPDDGGIDAAQIALAGRFNGRTDRDGGTYLSQSLRENPRTASVSAWLELLDMNVLVILALMTVVAVVTMMCSLLILILNPWRARRHGAQRVSLALRPHSLARYAVGQRCGAGHTRPAAFLRHRAPRPLGLLCRPRPRGVRRPPLPAHQRRHAARHAACPRPAQFHRGHHQARQDHALRIKNPHFAKCSSSLSPKSSANRMQPPKGESFSDFIATFAMSVAEKVNQ